MSGCCEALEKPSSDPIYISTLLWFNIDAIHSNTYIHYTQTDWAVSSYTNTSEGIWLLTATEWLWSVASINDISANSTQKKEKKKENGRQTLVARLEHIGDKQINAMVTVAACKLYI